MKNSMNFRFQKPETSRLIEKGYTAFDMHFHTRYSLDAISSINQSLRKARANGFGVAVTDHNEIKGARKAIESRIAQVIPGIEVTSQEGIHTLFYFDNLSELEEFHNRTIRPSGNPFFIEHPIYQLLDLASDYNCVICSPHPFSAGAPGLMNHDLSLGVLDRFHAVEIINGYNTRTMNRKAVTRFRNIGKAITGGSDGHTVHELGTVLTYADPGDFLESLRKRKTRVIGHEGNIFEKAILAMVKEENYMARAHKEKEALRLIGSQCRTELSYMRERLHLLKKFHSFHPPSF
ncbi:MAG: PHP domain-containing protein [Candidatus Woesearchaeota archaeon]